MPARPKPVQSLLQCLQDATKRHKSNPYQIAKATGLPLGSIQKLLAQSRNPTLHNCEVILAGYGIVLLMEERGPRTIGSSRLPKNVSDAKVPGLKHTTVTASLLARPTVSEKKKGRSRHV